MNAREMYARIVTAARWGGASANEVPTATAGAPDAPAADVRPELDLLPLYGELAPSPCNLRPWAFRRTGDALDIGPDHARAPAHGIAANREMVLSCGAALFNMRIALRHFGYRDRVTRVPHIASRWALARLQPGRQAHEESQDRQLFYAIPRRHTIRTGFVDRPLPRHLVDRLQQTAQMHGAWLRLVVLRPERHELSDLTFEAFVRSADETNEAACDQWTGGQFPSAGSLLAASRAQALLSEAPILAILGTAGDDAADWLVAGEALEEILLQAAADDVFAGYVNQPLRVADLRRWVGVIAGGGAPHVLFGLGHAPVAA
jgi:hypothetical protein